MGEHADYEVERLMFRSADGFRRVPRRTFCNVCGRRGLHWDQKKGGDGWRLAEANGTPHVCERDYFKDLKEH